MTDHWSYSHPVVSAGGDITSPPMMLMRRQRKPPKKIKLTLLRETGTDAQWPKPDDVVTMHAEGRVDLVI